MEKLSNRTTAFLIRSRLDYTIFDVCRYLDDNHKGIDCNEIKKKYMSISLNGANISSILCAFIKKEIKRSLDEKTEIPENVDLERLIHDNLDIFFDISVIDEDVTMIECAVLE